MHDGPRDQTLATPWAWIRRLETALGRVFDVDVCAAPRTAKALRYYTEADNGLAQPWDGLCWCNPPFESIGPWVSKALSERESNPENFGTVLVVPANRSDQAWWQKLRALEHAGETFSAYPGVRIAYVGGNGPSTPPFPSMFWGIGPADPFRRLRAVEGVPAPGLVAKGSRRSKLRLRWS